MSLTQFGVDTKRTLILKHESHKLHHEFEVGADGIKRGQPAVLNADGTISAAAAGAAGNTVVGYSVHNAAEGELATLVMRPFLIVFAQVNQATDAGPVAYGGQSNDDDDYANFTAIAAAGDMGPQVGFALDPATAAGDMIRVALI